MTTQMTPRPLPTKAPIVIIGGGIQGLACAYNLAARGIRDIVVLDKGYWQGGASGRNGSLIRGGFFSPEWTGLFAYSTQEWLKLSKRLRHNVMYSRRGYTMVGETAATAAGLENALPVHRDFGIRSFMLPPSKLARTLPALDRRTVTSALHQPDSGVAPHHAAMKAYLAACSELGVQVRYFTEVTGFEQSAGRLSAVLVGDHRLSTDCVVVACGGLNPDLARLLGVSLAGYGMRIEAMALEPVRPLIRPALALIDRLCYMHQTARGEVVGGTEVPERPRLSLNTDFPVLANTAKVYFDLFPQLREVRVMRHWAGLIHVSPDFAPMLGAHPAMANLWFSAGWSYGIAGAPGAGALLAKAIATGEVDSRMKPFALDRFDRGQPIQEGGIVLATHS